MKWLKVLKNLFIQELPHFSKKDYFIYLNGELIENLEGHSNVSHGEIYKKLRAFQTPQYQTWYIFKNKKGFNTWGFQRKYDVVILNHKGVVLEALTEIKPNYVSEHYSKAFYIIFTVVGTIQYYDLKKKDTLEVVIKWLKEKGRY